MKKFLSLLAASTILGAAPAAFAIDVNVKTDFDSKANGGYTANESSSSTTASGTVKATDRKVDVDVDADGDVSKTIKSKVTTDADGLMNKQQDKTKVKAKYDQHGNLDRTTESHHTNADGTDVSTEADTSTSVDADGNTHTETTVEKKTDPKGLFNSNTTKTKVEMKNGVVVKKTTDHDD